MRVLIAPLELKGTLSAREAAEAMADGLAEAGRTGEVDRAPLSDGGPGLLDALRTPDAEERLARVHDPLGRWVDARWLQVGQTAVLEMAEASGLFRLAPHERSAAVASSLGTGELLRAALDRGCTRLLLGLGGSATNDGGVGAARALGYRFLDAAGAELPPGGVALARLARIDPSARDPRLRTASIELATDVRNPLLGPLGASRVFGPQKGADPATVEALERGLARLAEVVQAQLGIASAQEPRTGAAGGLGYGLSALCGARRVDGFERVASELQLEPRIRHATWVLTAEGQLDAQSGFGKGTVQLATRCAALGTPCVAFVGRIVAGAPVERFAEVVEAPGTRETARDALRAAVARWVSGLHR